MTDLAAARTKRLHQDFLRASEQFPRLDLLAVTPSPACDLENDPDWQWPLWENNPSWRYIRETLCPGCHVLETHPIWLEDPRGGRLSEEVSPRHTFWTAGFVYCSTRRGLSFWERHCVLRLYRRAINRFAELGHLAMAHFLPAWAESGTATSAWHGPVLRWLSELWRLGLAESVSDNRFIVSRLRGSLFVASAQAVELLAAQGASAASQPDGDGETISRDRIAEILDITSKTLANRASELPQPVRRYAKNVPIYDYAALRLALIAMYPDKAFLLPEKLSDIQA